MSLQLPGLLERIDQVLESYEPDPAEPGLGPDEIIAHRASQNHLLKEAIQLATDGLAEFRENPELIRRRAYACCRFVSDEGEFTMLEEAQADFGHLLQLDPDNPVARLGFLEELFTFSDQNQEVADMADETACHLEELLLAARALQIRALAYADEHEESAEVYETWHACFPESEALEDAKAHADAMAAGS